MTTLREGIADLAQERLERDPRLKSHELRAWRLAHGITQAEAAQWVGVSRRTWIRYEMDERTPPRWLKIIVGLVPLPGHLNKEG